VKLNHLIHFGGPSESWMNEVAAALSTLCPLTRYSIEPNEAGRRAGGWPWATLGDQWELLIINDYYPVSPVQSQPQTLSLLLIYGWCTGWVDLCSDMR